MQKIDITRPLYEAAIENKNDMYEAITRETLRFISSVNPVAMSRWSSEDTKNSIELLRDTGYGIKVWSTALDRLKQLAFTQTVNFGHYYQLGHEINSHKTMYNLEPHKTHETVYQKSNKEVARSALALIRQQLRKGKAN